MTEYSSFEFRAGLLPLQSVEVDTTLLQDFGVERICLLNQISTDQIVTIDCKDIDNLPSGINKLGEADAFIINNYSPRSVRQTLLGITTADCLPVIVHSESQIAIIHAGWRGLALEIIQKTIRQMAIVRNSKLHIGAAAKGCCYEVGSAVLEALKLNPEPEKQKIDLQDLALGIFKDLLPEAEITLDSRCTICSQDLHSYRRDRTMLRNLSFVIV
jgi:YfiH family protein